MALTRYENTFCPISENILAADKYTFSVLSRILENPCRLTLTDHNRLIICHSANPYPVWVWTPDNASEEELSFAWQTIKEELPFQEGYSYNVKYSFAEYALKRGQEEHLHLEISMGLFAYCCPKLSEPEKTADGCFSIASEADLENIVICMEEFHNEIGIDKQSNDEYRKNAKSKIENGQLYLWKNAAGDITAMCAYRISGDVGTVNMVYTKKSDRRKGYASNLVYQATKHIIEQGNMPSLYTNADYAASNQCYQKLGYQLKGKLCTIHALP